MIEQTVAILERRNIIGVWSGLYAQGPTPLPGSAPGRLIPAYQLKLGREDTLSPDALRRHLEAGHFKVLGEIENQCVGIAPGDRRKDPYWALAEKLDIPVAIHMGEGYPGAWSAMIPYIAPSWATRFCSKTSWRYPRLRICVMHYGSPLVDEMIAVLYTHPQVYIETGEIQWTYPRQ